MKLENFLFVTSSCSNSILKSYWEAVWRKCYSPTTNYEKNIKFFTVL